MKAHNVEPGYVIRYDDKAWHVTGRAASTARGDGCVVMAELHDTALDVFVWGPVALVFDRFDEEVWVYHFASSPYPADWATPPETDWAALATCPRCHAPIGGPCTAKGQNRSRPHIERVPLDRTVV